MAKISANKIVKRLAESLSPDGFAIDGAYRLLRQNSAVRQFIEIQPGRGALAGKLMINLCWQFVADGASDAGTYDFAANLGYLMWSSQHWIDTAQANEIEPVVESIEQLIRDYGLPFLDRYQDIQVMLDAYEIAAKKQLPITSPIDPQHFFGIDVGWRNFQLAFAYKHVGNTAQSEQLFETVVSDHSKESFEWVQTRKQRCLDASLKLKSNA